MPKVIVGNPLGPSVQTGEIDNLAVTAAKLAADAVETAKMADNAVTLAKLAHGTANKLIGFDGTGTPAEVSGSGWQFVEEITPDGPSTADFSATLASDTDVAYMVVGHVVIETGAGILELRLNGSASSHDRELLKWTGATVSAAQTNATPNLFPVEASIPTSFVMVFPDMTTDDTDANRTRGATYQTATGISVAMTSGGITWRSDNTVDPDTEITSMGFGVGSDAFELGTRFILFKKAS